MEESRMAELHQELQQVSSQINQAQEDVLNAQGANMELVEDAEIKIEQARQALQTLQNTNGKEALENTQFQQAFETLHDVQQQIQEAQQNRNDIL